MNLSEKMFLYKRKTNRDISEYINHTNGMREAVVYMKSLLCHFTDWNILVGTLFVSVHQYPCSIPAVTQKIASPTG